jgi:hypothetical protein
METRSLKQLEKVIKDVLLLFDDGVIKMLTASVIANRLSLDPVWLLMVSGSGSGKTELSDITTDLDFIHSISDLTTNTFASGLRSSGGRENSLLPKLNNGIMVFNDFTTILSKHSDERLAIMGQLREIYDGNYVKRTGNGEDVVWNGRIGAIAGSTEIVYKYLEDLSTMGDRFIMYSVDTPTNDQRKLITKRSIRNTYKMDIMRERMKAAFTSYVTYVLENTDIDEVRLDETVEDKIIEIADFTAASRSGLAHSDRTGAITFIPSKEIGTRIAKQLMTLSTAFIVMSKVDHGTPEDHPCWNNQLTKADEKLLHKVAFTSIPRTRRDSVVLLAKYEKGVTTRGVAEELNLSTGVVNDYLTQLNALSICTRIKGVDGVSNEWHIEEKWRSLVLELEGVHIKHEKLVGKKVAGLGEEFGGRTQHYEEMALMEDLENEDWGTNLLD